MIADPRTAYPTIGIGGIGRTNVLDVTFGLTCALPALHVVPALHVLRGSSCPPGPT
jgi:hypothetical protein